ARTIRAMIGCRACEPVCPSGVRYGQSLEAAVQVKSQLRVVSGRGIPRQRPHQDDAAAGTVGFVPGHDEGGAALETESAMDAGVEPGEIGPGHSAPGAATRTCRGSNVRRREVTSRATPSR